MLVQKSSLDPRCVTGHEFTRAERIEKKGVLTPESVNGDNDATHTHFVCNFSGGGFRPESAPLRPSAGRPKWEVFGGYTYMHSNIVVTGSTFNMNGASGSVAYHLTDWFALVGEFASRIPAPSPRNRSASPSRHTNSVRACHGTITRT